MTERTFTQMDSTFILSVSAHVETVYSRGFAIIRGFAPQSASSDAARQPGEVDSVEGLDIVQSLIPRTINEAEPNTYSGALGTCDEVMKSVSRPLLCLLLIAIPK
jgi:hypothetical protein